MSKDSQAEPGGVPSGQSVDEAGARLQSGAEPPFVGALPTLDDESYVEESESESYVEESESESYVEESESEPLIDDSEVELGLIAEGYHSSESEYESLEESDDASESEAVGVARIGVVTRKVQRGVAFAQPIVEEARSFALPSEDDDESMDDPEDRTGEWDLSESISEYDPPSSGISSRPEPSGLSLGTIEGSPLIIEAEEAPDPTVFNEDLSLADDDASSSLPISLGEDSPPAMSLPRSPEGLGAAQVKVHLGARREGEQRGNRDDFTVTVAQAEADAQSLEILGALDGLFEEDSFVEEDSVEEEEPLGEEELGLSDEEPAPQKAVPVDLGAVDEPIQALSGDENEDEAEEIEGLNEELNSAWDEALEAQSLGTIEAVEAPEEALPQDDLDLDTFFEAGPPLQGSEGPTTAQAAEVPSLPFNQPSSEAKEVFGGESDDPEEGRLTLFALDLGEPITPNPDQMTPATDELARLPFYVEEQTQASPFPVDEEDLADLAPADLELEIEPMVEPEAATPPPPEPPPPLVHTQPEPPQPVAVSIEVREEKEEEADVVAMSEERPESPDALEEGPKPKGWVELDFELPVDTILTPSKEARSKGSQPPPAREPSPKPPLNEVGLSIARLFGEEALTHAFAPEAGSAPGSYSEADIGLPEGWAAPPPPVDIEIDLDFDAGFEGGPSSPGDPIAEALNTLEDNTPEVHIDPIQAALAELEGTSGFSPDESGGRELDLDIPLAFLEGAPTLDSPKPLDIDAAGAPSPWDAPSEKGAQGSRPPVSFGEEERPWWLPPEVEGEARAEESAASTDVDDLWSAVWTTPSSANPPALPKGSRAGSYGIDGDLPGLGEETPRLDGANPLGQRAPPPSNQRRAAAPDPLEAALKVVQGGRDDFKPQRRTLPPRRSIGRGRSPAPPPPSDTAPLPEAPRARRSTRVSDRRQNARVVDVGGKVYFRRRGRIATGTLRDLSFSGCAVLTQSPLAPGAEVPLGLEVGGMRTIRVISRVVWCRQADPYGVEGESCMGVTFQHLEPEDRRLLSTFLSRVSL